MKSEYVQPWCIATALALCGTWSPFAQAQSGSSDFHRNTSAVSVLGGFRAPPDAGPPAPVADPPPGTVIHVGGTGTVAADQHPEGTLRDCDVAPTVDMHTPIGPSDVALLFHAHEAALRGCYARALGAHPELAGRMLVRFVIGRDGQITQPSATGLTDAPEVAGCMVTALQQMRFPPSAMGTLPFTYPMMFSPPPAPARRGHHGHGHHGRSPS